VDITVERITRSGIAGLGLLVWSAITLTEAGWFNGWLPVVIALGGFGLVWMIRPPPEEDPSRTKFTGHGWAVVLALSSLVLTSRPHEMILGGWDPGVYVHTAAQVARTGSLQFDHPDLLALSAGETGLMVRDLHGISEPFGGMRILPNGKISPQFYHAYPTLLAVFYSWGGVEAALWVNPLLNVFSLLAFYALVALLTGHRGLGLLAMLALALNPGQIWQARFCTAEMLTQCLLLCGLALGVKWQKSTSHSIVIPLLMGFMLGLALLTRYDTIMWLAVFLSALLIPGVPTEHRRGLWWMLGAVALLMAQAWAHQRWIAPYYTPLGGLVQKALLALGVVVLLLSLLVRRLNRWPRGIRTWRIVESPLRAAMGLGFAGWMFFNGIVRPTIHQRTNFMRDLSDLLSRYDLEPWADALAGPAARTMLFLQSLLGPLGLAVAIVCTALLIWRLRGVIPLAWLAAGVIVTLILTWNPLNDLFMMWVSRRYIPVVLPLLIASGFVALGMLLQSFPRLSRTGMPLGIFLVIALLAPVRAAIVFNSTQTEWPGLANWFRAVDDALPESAIVYTDQPHFGSTLRFLFGHRAYELQHPSPERREQFVETLSLGVDRHDALWLLTQNAITNIPDNLRIEEKNFLPLDTHMMEQPPDAAPTGLRGRGGDFRLYYLTSKRRDISE
jgi:hypothetical protein